MTTVCVQNSIRQFRLEHTQLPFKKLKVKSPKGLLGSGNTLHFIGDSVMKTIYDTFTCLYPPEVIPSQFISLNGLADAHLERLNVVLRKVQLTRPGNLSSM